LPEDNRPYWKAKVAGNRLRDRRASRKLRAEGWTVLRFWEHALDSQTGCERTLAKITAALARVPDR
jgi:DNA mismatch endonuclease (patch repair protein)